MATTATELKETLLKIGITVGLMMMVALLRVFFTPNTVPQASEPKHDKKPMVHPELPEEIPMEVRVFLTELFNKYADKIQGLVISDMVYLWKSLKDWKYISESMIVPGNIAGYCDLIRKCENIDDFAKWVRKGKTDAPDFPTWIHCLDIDQLKMLQQLAKTLFEATDFDERMECALKFCVDNKMPFWTNEAFNFNYTYIKNREIKRSTGNLFTALRQKGTAMVLYNKRPIDPSTYRKKATIVAVETVKSGQVVLSAGTGSAEVVVQPTPTAEPVEETKTAPKMTEEELAEKNRLGDLLYPKIEGELSGNPNEEYKFLCPKITGMFLEMDNHEIETLISDDESLTKKIAEAIGVLEAAEDGIDGFINSGKILMSN